MKWGVYLTSAVGKKLVMAFTGIFLILFLIVHVTVNSCIFVPDHGETFNKVAHFFGTNWVVHLLEVGLFVGILLHIIQGLALTIQNRSKRPVRYAVNRRSENSHWYSRSMGLLGTLILIFLIIHLGDFWVHTRFAGLFGGTGEVIYDQKPMDDLFGKMKQVFAQGWIVVIYLAGVFSLAWHLVHGFQSAFRTLGMTSYKYIPIVRGAGIAFAIIVCILFALMPVLIYFGVVR